MSNPLHVFFSLRFHLSLFIFFYTLIPSAPGAPPLAVSGIALDSRRLNITWKPPPRTKQNRNITGYKIMYVESDGVKTKNEVIVVNVDADVNSYILTDLSKWTQYKIWLLASTSIGESSSSQPILVSTEEDGRYQKNDPNFEVALGDLTCFLTTLAYQTWLKWFKNFNFLFINN